MQPAPGKGRGVFTTQPFKKGEYICEYAGELLSSKEANLRERKYRSNLSVGCYMLEFEFKGKKMW